MSALNALRAGCVLLLAIAPWVLATAMFTSESRQWQCDTPFEVLRLTPQGQQIRVFARLSQYYHPDGHGLERLNGRVETLTPDKPLHMRTFHRVAEFAYGQAGPYLKKRIEKVSRAMGDTMPAKWALEYFHEPESDYYLQVMKVGERARALGAIAMPRLYCSASGA